MGEESLLPESREKGWRRGGKKEEVEDGAHWRDVFREGWGILDTCFGLRSHQVAVRSACFGLDFRNGQSTIRTKRPDSRCEVPVRLGRCDQFWRQHCGFGDGFSQHSHKWCKGVSANGNVDPHVAQPRCNRLPTENDVSH